MKIDITAFVAIIGSLSAIYFAIKNYQSMHNKSLKKDAFESAKISVKLDEIGNDVKDIKYDISSVKTEVKEIDKRLSIAENEIILVKEKIN